MKARHDEHPTAHKPRSITVNHKYASHIRRLSRVDNSTLRKTEPYNDIKTLREICQITNDKLSRI